MIPLILDKTEDTPEVILDKTGNQFYFEGQSIPEDIHKFYDPIMDWINTYLESPNDETIVHFKLKYFNSSSAKCIQDILEQFITLSENKKMIIINWHFLEEDVDMFEAGEMLSEALKFKFNYISY